ncbi:MAG: CPBP family intramembrane metalloprotease [Clostridia bacterium]|nr:CPBP family intramembrane metalloprotease [Clostridia bacterium]
MFKNNIRNVLLFAAVSMLVNITLSIVVGGFGLYKNFELYMISLIVITVFSAFVPARMLSGKIQKFKPSVVDEKSKINFLDKILLIIMGFSGCITINLIVAIISTFFPAIGGGNADISQRSDTYAVIFMIIATALSPAIFEELGFRKFVMGNLKDFGDGFAVFFSSLIFGMMHGQLSSILFAFLSGILFALIYKKTENIVYTMIVHFMNNAFAECSIALSKNISEEVYGGWMLLFYFSMIVVFITSLIIVKKKMPDFFKFSNNSLLISADKWKITLSRPIFWSFVITVIMVAVMY